MPTGSTFDEVRKENLIASAKNIEFQLRAATMHAKRGSIRTCNEEIFEQFEYLRKSVKHLIQMTEYLVSNISKEESSG